MKKKIGHFWYYYKWHVMIPVVIVIALIFGIRTYIYENRDVAIYISMINCKDEYSVDEYLTNYANELLKSNVITSEFRLEGGFIHPEVVDETVAADSMVTASIQRYQAEVISRKTESVIASDWVVKEYAQADAYCDLSEVLSEEDLELYKDRILYCKNMEGKEIAAGIYLNDKLFVEAYEDKAPVFAINSYVEDKSTAILFLKYCAQ